MSDQRNAPSHDHLIPTITNRGFSHLRPIPSQYGGEAKVYESSAAFEPHIWLNVECPVSLNEPQGEMKEAVMHLTAEDAWRLAEQLQHLVCNHYQGDATPEWATVNYESLRYIVEYLRHRDCLPSDEAPHPFWRHWGVVDAALGPEAPNE